MRTRGKVLSSVLAMAMIMGAFPFAVAADNEIEASGSVTYYDEFYNTEKTYYDYQLYTNGDFKVKYYEGSLDFGSLNSQIVYNISNVEIDFSAAKTFPFIDGGDCKAGSLKMTGLSGSVYRLYLFDFPSLETIDMPEDIGINHLTINHVGVESLDMFDDRGVESISLQYCNNLIELKVPSTVTYLNLQECACLSKVVLADDMEQVNIYECPSLKSVESSSSVDIFRWQDVEASEIVIPVYNRNCNIRSYELEKATLTNGTTSVGGAMFDYCTKLSEVNIPGSVTSVQYSAFRNCSSLKSITLPSSVRDIDNYAFAESGLESFTFPSSLINIQYKVFYNCENLKSITIPTSVECIDATAFAGCTALKDVYYQGTEAQWNQIMFDPEDISVSKIFNNATIHFNVQSGWAKDGNTWYFYDDTGNKVKGWKEIKDKWYYFDTNGKMQTGWQQLNGKWYYLDDDGAMATGWTQIKGKWYYLDSEGAMKTGWYQSGSNWYYLNSDGDMATGWKSVSGKWYYFESSGEMVTGWKSVSGKWYCFTDDGDMMTGWVEDDGVWYYLKSDGSMAVEEYCGGYWLNAEGKWSYKYKADWHKNANGWWYGDESGWYAKNETLIIDGVSYDFDSIGYMK